MFNGCDLQPVNVKSVGNVEFKSLNNNIVTLKVTATVDNPNMRIKIKKTDLTVYLNNTEMGRITQLDNIVLKSRSTQEYTVPVKVELTNLKGSIMTGMSLISGKRGNISLSGQVKVGTAFYTKTVKLDKYPVKL